MSTASLLNSSPPGVLFVDHSGHPAPLTMCYHATSSRILSSSIDDRGNPSTSTEVDSAYCPSCLSFYDQATAASADGARGYCPRATCRSCPLCLAALAIAVGPVREAEGDGDVCYYSCGHCRWTSVACRVIGPAPSSASPGKEELRVATDGLGAVYKERLAEISKGAPGLTSVGPHKAYTTLQNEWAALAEEERGLSSSTIRRSGSGSALRIGDGPEGWSVESLEKSLEKQRAEASIKLSSALVNGLKLDRLTIQNLSEKDNSPSITSRLTVDQARLQSVLGPGTAMAAARLPDSVLPLPIPLRARKSRRCRAELAAGRTGILVKPKLNPLEGDSSLRSGHGQWWKKDSSAIHVVPRVRIVHHGRGVISASGSGGSRIRHALLLSVSNPTLGMIRTRLIGAERDDYISLQNVLLDPLLRNRVNARMICGTSTLVLSDMVELEPVEDAFLGMGKGQSHDPKEVEGWDADEVLNVEAGQEDSSSVGCSFRTVAVNKDTAWIELLVTEDEDTVSPSGSEVHSSDYIATPVTLQIEVGNGSWENSLIKPKEAEDGGDDIVSLRLVLVWKSS